MKVGDLIEQMPKKSPTQWEKQDGDLRYHISVAPLNQINERIEAEEYLVNVIAIDVYNPKSEKIGHYLIDLAPGETTDLLAESLVETYERGFARRLVTTGVNVLQKYANDSNKTILDCVTFLFGCGHGNRSQVRLSPIFESLGYTIPRGLAKHALEKRFTPQKQLGCQETIDDKAQE
jgi:hypothetical protein